MTIFGDMKSARLLEQAAIDTLKEWLPTYLAEGERQFDREEQSMPHPKHYGRVKEFEKWPENKLPALLVISPGLDGTRPRKDGEGRYRANFILGVGIALKTRDKNRTNDLVKDYAAVIRTLMVQKGTLGGYANGTEYRDESHNVADTEDQQRTLGTAQVIFSVELENLTQWGTGPVVVPDDPYDPPPAWGVVQEVETEVLHVEDIEG